MAAVLSPGSIFAGDFRVIRHLADGGMGAVYVVEQLSTGKQRALKTMHVELARDTKHRARFETEARLSGRIESDHVVEVLAAGFDQATDLPWLVMELLRGDTLDALVEREGPRSIFEVREIARQLRHVLERAHVGGLVHRDLKPENIFLAIPRREGVAFTVKILDFGIAKWVQEAQTAMKNSQIIGSPLWMAPEQLSPGADITGATDVWALGLIFFYLLTGKHYWKAANTEGSSVSALLLEVAITPMGTATERAAEFGAPGLLPPGFDEWFAKATNRVPGQRYPEGGAAMGALDALLERAAEGVEDMAAEPTVPGTVRDKSSLAHTLDADSRQMDDPELALRLARVFELRDSDRERAIGAYRRVLELAPGSPEALRGLASLYRRAGDWAALVDVLQQELSRRTLQPGERSARLIEIADVERSHLGDVGAAEKALREALEVEPGSQRAVDALASLLESRGELSGAIDIVESVAVELQKRGDQDGRFALLCRVADLQGTRDDLRDQALDALQRAAAIRPDAVEVRRRFAALYARGPEAEPGQARRYWTEVLSVDLRQEEAWEALFELEHRVGTPDSRWCVADAALAVLGDDTPAAIRDHRSKHASAATKAPSGRYGDAALADLFGSDLDPRVAQTLGHRGKELSAKFGKPLATFGLGIKELVDPGTSSRALLQQAMPIYRALLAAAGVLDVAQMPAVYLRATDRPGLTQLRSVPAATLVGGAWQRPWTPAELAFAAGEHMAFYRPELQPRVLVPDAAALAAELPAGLDVGKWRHEAERVAARAGLVMARELGAARTVLSEIEPHDGGISAPERFKDLVLFAISERYGRVRRELGLALK